VVLQALLTDNFTIDSNLNDLFNIAANGWIGQFLQRIASLLYYFVDRDANVVTVSNVVVDL